MSSIGRCPYSEVPLHTFLSCLSTAAAPSSKVATPSIMSRGRPKTSAHQTSLYNNQIYTHCDDVCVADFAHAKRYVLYSATYENLFASTNIHCLKILLIMIKYGLYASEFSVHSGMIYSPNFCQFCCFECLPQYVVW